jgi:hypothetical protein
MALKKDEPESPDLEEIEDPDGEGFPFYEAEWSWIRGKKKRDCV